MSVLICVNEGDDMLLCVIEFMSMFGSGCESVGIHSSVDEHLGCFHVLAIVK